MAEESQEGGRDASLGNEGGGDQGKGPTTRAAKTCTGWLYYASTLKSGSDKPVCYGISGTFPGVPQDAAGRSEWRHVKDENDLSDFKYACVGYSVFLDNKDNSTDMQENRMQLPLCSGIEILALPKKKMSTNDHVHTTVHEEDNTAHTPPQVHRPAQSSGDELPIRFVRNAGLVAAAVVKNLNEVGTYIKESIDDMMNPYRKRSK